MMTRTQKAKAGAESHERDDTDPSDTGGADADNPEDKDEGISGEVDTEFNRILRIAFQISNTTKHEVFESLQDEGIYSWGLFIEVDFTLISSLT